MSRENPKAAGRGAPGEADEPTTLHKRLIPLPDGHWGMRDWLGTTPLKFSAELSEVSPTPYGLYRLDGIWKDDYFTATTLVLLSPSPNPEENLQTLAACGGPERAVFSDTLARQIRLRTRLLRRSRAFLDERGFEEVEVPNLISEPGCDPNIRLFRTSFDPLAGAGSPRTLYLQTSPELTLKRLLVAGADAIYRAGSVFRNGERSPRHEPEFLMVEWYRVGATLEDLKREATALVVALFEEAKELGFTPPRIQAPLPEMNLCALFKKHTGVDPLSSFDGPTFAQALTDAGLGPFAENCSYQEAFYQAVVERLEPRFQQLGSFYVENFPTPLAILSKRSPEDPRVARRVEGYLQGVEFANGFEELTDPVEQRQRFQEDLTLREEHGGHLPPLPEEFLASLGAGMPPAAGIAVGLDRIVQLACGTESIQDVLPLTPGKQI